MARQQYAALPFRKAPTLEVMLLSSRDTRRWVLPKGWPMKGVKPHGVAAIEAMEEAGLTGKIAKKAIGSYHYVKRMRNGAALLCKVDVFPFRFGKQRKNWLERDQRATQWFTPEEAAELVHEPELRALILQFSRRPSLKAGDETVVTLETAGR
ncbi:MAG: NUDIX hydrolase [Hyphomicrobiales bacterium]|nr:NUDIX hydrolase [Hyphomicrobiales bacterium]